jgi:hypothetical protein
VFFPLRRLGGVATFNRIGLHRWGTRDQLWCRARIACCQV